jgi:hypothetical protein
MSISEDDLKENEEGRLCLSSGEPYTGETEDYYEDGKLPTAGTISTV